MLNWSTLYRIPWWRVGSSCSWRCETLRISHTRVSSGRTLVDYSSPKAWELSQAFPWVGYRDNREYEWWRTRIDPSRSGDCSQSTQGVFSSSECSCSPSNPARVWKFGSLFLVLSFWGMRSTCSADRQSRKKRDILSCIWIATFCSRWQKGVSYESSSLLDEWLHLRVRYFSCDIKRSQKTGDEFCRTHDHLCLHAGCWHGRRSSRFLFSEKTRVASSLYLFESIIWNLTYSV